MNPSVMCSSILPVPATWYQCWLSNLGLCARKFYQSSFYRSSRSSLPHHVSAPSHLSSSVVPGVNTAAHTAAREMKGSSQQHYREPLPVAPFLAWMHAPGLHCLRARCLNCYNCPL